MIEALVHKIQSQTNFISFEITPSISSTLDSAFIEELKGCDFIDGFACTDSPLARFKPSSIISSFKFQNALNKPVICTLSMRDRNSIALCGDILAVNEFDIRLFLGVTGDPIKLGNCPESKGVFEASSLKLFRIIANLNSGIDLNGTALRDNVKHIYSFSVINSYSQNPKTIESKMRKKLESGVLALFTQPVYSRECALSLLESMHRQNLECNSNAALIFGFFPITSYKAALFLRDKLPGVFIPELWVQKLQKAHEISRDDEYKVGFELSLKLFRELQIIHNKFHFMNSNRINLAKQFF